MVQESEQFPDLLCEEGPANTVKEASMKRTIFIVLGALVAMGAIAGGLVYAKWDTAVDLVSMAVNYVKYRMPRLARLLRNLHQATKAMGVARPRR
jgi:hypothetical protein